MTQEKAPNQTVNKTIVNIKCKIGTKITLFVQARKSADASITSIANLNELNPHAMQQKNKIAKNPNTKLAIKRYFYLLINSS